MTTIHNDIELKEALSKLDATEQRELAARFVEDVLEYTDDERVRRAIKVARKPDATEDELKAAHHEARAAALDAHARCGADCEWSAQSPYFVARAAEAITTRQTMSEGKNLAWTVATQCRTASCCLVSEENPDSEGNTCSSQRQIASEYLNSHKDPHHD